MKKHTHTFALVHLPIDLGEDARVAEGGDEQRENKERHKVKHVVRRLLPALPETSMSCTLSEVHAIHLHSTEDEELRMRRDEEFVCIKQTWHVVVCHSVSVRVLPYMCVSVCVCVSFCVLADVRRSVFVLRRSADVSAVVS